MSRAFDLVPRQLVEAAIRDAGFSQATESAMLVWLQASTYVIRHKGLTAENTVHQRNQARFQEWAIGMEYHY